MGRVAVFVYGSICYAMFLGVFLYAFGFIGGVFVPKTIDAGAWPAALPTALAVAVNFGLLLSFGLQHSIMARPTFKNWWTRFVPWPAERSTYVLATNLCMIALFVLWQPLPGIVWDAQWPMLRAGLWTLFVTGWVIVLISTFLINHFDLFGLRQVWLHLRGREYTHLPFATPLVYKHIRHPLYVGWITAFWAIPTMTVGHLMFAGVMTSYILVAIVFEERNLVEHHGESYRAYQRLTGKFVPRLRFGGVDDTNSQPELAKTA